MSGLIYILNGPNLNLLGKREPEIYGVDTLADIEQRLFDRAEELDVQIDFRQSNHEGELVDWIHEGRDNADGFIVNMGAYTHTSIAILDALKGADKPVIEVHLSNLHAREPFRHKSYITPIAAGFICGLGPLGYELALEAIANLLDD